MQEAAPLDPGPLAAMNKLHAVCLWFGGMATRGEQSVSVQHQEVTGIQNAVRALDGR